MRFLTVLNHIILTCVKNSHVAPIKTSYIKRALYHTYMDKFLIKSPNTMKKFKGEQSREDHTSSGSDNKPTDKNFGFGQRKPIDTTAFKQFLFNIKQSKSTVSAEDFDKRRVRDVNHIKSEPDVNYRGVSFWMFRDQRIDDNWALIYAQMVALKHECPLYVTFFLMSHYSVAGTRQYDFMLRGLQQVETQCQKLGIQFHLELGYAKDLIEEYCEKNKIDFVVADMCPLRDPMSWLEEAGRKLKNMNIPLHQVDAHNIIPVWVTSDKQEFAARTIRPRIHKHLNKFLTEIPVMEKHPYLPDKSADPVDWDAAWEHLNIDEKVKPVSWAEPGTLSGYKMLYEFITQRLENYDTDRNEPTKHGLSCLSPYYHFGQLSVQRAILCLTDKSLSAKKRKAGEVYIEEAVVRRELSDNFCFYNPDYDNFDGAADWAKKTHEEHRRDRRDHIYSLEELQYAKTHDKLWNACQIQMLLEGKMHGYMRMYWAKKILEWTPSVEEAIRCGIFLNDKYELDGRDPNGYVGIMWSMVGTHDRGWTERPVFGKIRYMNYNGCARKFDIDRYMRFYNKI